MHSDFCTTCRQLSSIKSGFIVIQLILESLNQYGVPPPSPQHPEWYYLNDKTLFLFLINHWFFSPSEIKKCSLLSKSFYQNSLSKSCRLMCIVDAQSKYIHPLLYSLLSCSFHPYICMPMSKVEYFSHLKFTVTSADQWRFTCVLCHKR